MVFAVWQGLFYELPQAVDARRITAERANLLPLRGHLGTNLLICIDLRIKHK